MEENAQLFEVCIICALPEEVRAFLEVVQQHCASPLEERISPRYQYSARATTLKNNKGELLNVHISWLPRYGPQEMTLHLSRVLEEYQPRIVLMTGICAGDSQQVQLGDLCEPDTWLRVALLSDYLPLIEERIAHQDDPTTQHLEEQKKSVREKPL